MIGRQEVDVVATEGNTDGSLAYKQDEGADAETAKELGHASEEYAESEEKSIQNGGDDNLSENYEPAEVALCRRRTSLSRRWTFEVPSVVMSQLSSGGVSKLVDASPLAEPVVVCVLDIGRYLGNLDFFSRSSSSGSAHLCDAIDILVLDGDRKFVTCSLSSSLCHQVLLGALRSPQVIRIRDKSVRYNELQLGGGPPSVTVQELEGTATEAWPSSTVSSSVQVAFDRPVCSSQGFYLALCSDDCVVSSSWIPEDISFEETCFLDVVLDEFSPSIPDIITIYHKYTSTKKRKKSSLSTPIVGRVIAISNLNFFGKTSDSNQHPINFQMVVADSSGSVTVSVWNSACRLYYPSIELGDVLVIVNYTMKPSLYANSIVSTYLENTEKNTHEKKLEVSINSKNPEGYVFTLSNYSSGLQFPALDEFLQCTWFGEVDSLSKSSPSQDNNSTRVVDMAGIITFLGESWCTLSNRTSKLVLMRWINIWVPRSQADQDLSNDGEEISVLLHANSQLDSFQSLSQLKIIFFCNLLFRTLKLSSSPDEPLFYYLESSMSTRIYLDDAVPYNMGYLLLKSWRTQPILEETLSKHANQTNLYIPFDDLSSLLLAFPDTELVSFASVPDLISSFRISQTKTVLLQGYITKVYFGPDDLCGSAVSEPTSKNKRREQEKGNEKGRKKEIKDIETNTETNDSQHNGSFLLLDLRDLNGTMVRTLSVPLPLFPFRMGCRERDTKGREWTGLFPDCSVPDSMVAVFRGEKREVECPDFATQFVAVVHFRRETSTHVSATASNFFSSFLTSFPR